MFFFFFGHEKKIGVGAIADEEENIHYFVFFIVIVVCTLTALSMVAAMLGDTPYSDMSRLPRVAASLMVWLALAMGRRRGGCPPGCRFTCSSQKQQTAEKNSQNDR